MWTRVTSSGAPVPVRAHAAGAATSTGTGVTVRRDGQAALRIMVRQCLGNAARGRPQSDFTADLARLKAAGVEVGEKFLGRYFTTAVEHAGACVVREAASHFQRRLLPSLDIPSDVELFFDAGTIGRVFKSVRSTVQS